MSYNCNVLVADHWTLGIDFHDNITPPAVVPVKAPYVWVSPLSGLFKPTLKLSFVVMSNNSFVMQRGTDIGAFLLHVGNPANIMLPFIILGSGSKSEFGAFSVLAENKPMAIAVAKVINLNLNCWGPTMPSPFPVPSGLVGAFNTNHVGVRLGDIIASTLALVQDAILQAILNYAGAKIGGKLANLFVGAVSGPRIIFSSGLVRILRSNVAFGNGIGFVLADLIVGCPLGYSTSHYGIDGLPLPFPTSTTHTRNPNQWLADKEDGYTDDQNNQHQGELPYIANGISSPDHSTLPADSPLRDYSNVEEL